MITTLAINSIVFMVFGIAWKRQGYSNLLAKILCIGLGIANLICLLYEKGFIILV